MADDKTQVRIASGNLALKCIKGAYSEQLFEIKNTLSIGREPSCDIVINSNLVSRQHANIRRDGDSLLLADNNSSNGSYVNDMKVMSYRLNAGDKLTFGDEEFSVVFRPDEVLSSTSGDAGVAVGRPVTGSNTQETKVMEAVVIGDGSEQAPLQDDQQTIVAPAVSLSDQQTVVFTPASLASQQTVVSSVDALAEANNSDKTVVSPRGASIQAPPVTKTVSKPPVSAAKAIELVGRMEPVAGRVFLLNKPLVTVGRSPFNDIILKTDSVSSHHAEIECQDGQWLVRDLFSSNGSYVNGVRIEEQDLLAGDIVMFGELALDFDPAGKDDSSAPAREVPSVGGSNVGLIVAAALGGFVVAMLAAYFLLR